MRISLIYFLTSLLLSRFGIGPTSRELFNTSCHILFRPLIPYFCCWKLCLLSLTNDWHPHFGAFGNTVILEFGMMLWKLVLRLLNVIGIWLLIGNWIMFPLHLLHLLNTRRNNHLMGDFGRIFGSK